MKAGPARKRRAVVEEIEPRILYSADFAPGLVDTATLTPSAEQRVVEPTGEFTNTTRDAHTRRHEIVFVDPATPDYDKLIEDIRAQDGERHIEVVLLDGGKDGVKQISDTLAARSDISAVHLVSHGSDGAVQLGSSTLDFDSLLKNATPDQRLEHGPDRRCGSSDLWLRGGGYAGRQVPDRCIGSVDWRGCGSERGSYRGSRARRQLDLRVSNGQHRDAIGYLHG